MAEEKGTGAILHVARPPGSPTPSPVERRKRVTRRARASGLGWNDGGGRRGSSAPERDQTTTLSLAIGSPDDKMVTSSRSQSTPTVDKIRSGTLQRSSPTTCAL